MKNTIRVARFPFYYGWILGDYQLTFISAGLLCLIASGLVIRIRKQGGVAHKLTTKNG